MASLRQLFEILDGRALEPGAIVLEPGPAIEGARRALAAGRDDAEALAALEAQLASFRALHRLAVRGLLDGQAPDDLERLADLGVELHHLAASLHMAARRWEPAREHLVQGIALRPERPDLRYRLVDLATHAGAYADAIGALELVQARLPAPAPGLAAIHAAPVYSLALAVRRRGGVKEACQAWERLAAGRSAFAPLATLQLEVERGERPAESLAAGERRHARVAELLDAGQWRSAIGLQRRLLAADPDDAEGWHRLGRAHLGSGLRQAGIERAPSPAASAAARSDLEAAAEALHMAVGLRGDLGAAQRELARCSALLGRREQALAAARDALLLDPTDETSRRLLEELEHGPRG